MKSYSFIIPVYNCEKYISKCIQSVVDIGVKYYELILIDDGSIDQSGNICDAYAKKNSQIKVIHQKNKGVSAARNLGMKEASMDYIIFLDADDQVDVNEFRMLINQLEHVKEYDLVFFGMSFDYYYHAKCYRRDKMFYPIEGVMEKDKWITQFYNLYESNCLSPIWNKVLKRQIIVDNHLRFDEDMFLYEDLQFVFRYMAYCNQIYNCEKIIYRYRQTEDEGNAKRRLLRINCITDLIDQINEALDYMISVKKITKQEDIINLKKVLGALYMVLANEKIFVCNRVGITKICQDMKVWYGKQPEEIKKSMRELDPIRIQKMLNCDAMRLYLECKKTIIRHKIAVRVKNTKIYQKTR